MSTKFVMILLVTFVQSKGVTFEKIELKLDNLSEVLTLNITPEKSFFYYKVVLNPANLLDVD